MLDIYSPEYAALSISDKREMLEQAIVRCDRKELEYIEDGEYKAAHKWMLRSEEFRDELALLIMNKS